MMKKHIPQHRKMDRCDSNSADVLMPLTGFKKPYIPDVTAIKLVYSDYRTLTAAVNQADYVYRLNSIFDPDFTGVGGQPDGYDQWANLYTQYRVIGAKWEVEANANGANTQCGLLAVSPSTSSASYASAEELVGLRFAKACVYTNSQPAKVRGRVHIAQMTGQSDVAILSNNDFVAAIGASPTTGAQQFLHVAAECNSATGSVNIWAKITFYVRFERPVATIDTAYLHRMRLRRGLVAVPRLDSTTQGGSSTTRGGDDHPRDAHSSVPCLTQPVTTALASPVVSFTSPVYLDLNTDALTARSTPVVPITNTAAVCPSCCHK